MIKKKYYYHLLVLLFDTFGKQIGESKYIELLCFQPLSKEDLIKQLNKLRCNSKIKKAKVYYYHSLLYDYAFH